MPHLSELSCGLLLLVSAATHAAADPAAEVAELRRLLEQTRSDYAARLQALEERLTRAEALASGAGREAQRAAEAAEEAAIGAMAGSSAPNVFNPAIGTVLVAGYADIDQGWEAIPGFLPGGELGPGAPGFSLGESELNLKAAIDTRYFGSLTLALADEDGETEIGIEEAWIQTTALPGGLTLLGGRFFSGLGYLNKSHRHADDFVDRPLPYQAFLGGQYLVDGLQMRWIAPTPMFLEFGAELNWSNRFPASAQGNTAADAWTAFAHLGGDFGLSHSWQLGLSYLASDIAERAAGDDAEAFRGDSDLLGIDLVWKWAPQGNPSVHSFKLQAEHFWRSEDGEFAMLPYHGDQSGWYLQGVWQFRPGWRFGYRHDRVEADNGMLLAGTALADPGYAPQRDSVMVDWSYSEFSRLRLQYVRDRVLETSDDQLFLQYLMSIGAHGAHEF